MNRAAIVILMPVIFWGHGRAATVDLADPALRVHAELARHNPPGPSLAEGLAAARTRMPANLGPWKGLDIISGHSQGLSFEPMVLLQIYGKLACQSDAILVGRAGASLSHLSTWGSSVYTDYEFTVEKVWKDSAALLGSTTSVVVTRPGGSVTLPEGHVNWRSQEFPPLRSETVYLLFLHLVRGSLGYEAMDSLSTLEVDKVPGFSREGFEKAISERVAVCKSR